MMKLYHVQADDPEGENLDWFVVAEDANQCAKLWAGVVDDNGFDSEEGVTRIREILPTVAGTVFDGPARAVDWSSLPTVFER